MEMLDLEQDEILCDHIREAVSAILGAVGAENPRKWLSLCKGVLSLAANSDGVSKQPDIVRYLVCKILRFINLSSDHLLYFKSSILKSANII